MLLAAFSGLWVGVGVVVWLGCGWLFGSGTAPSGLIFPGLGWLSGSGVAPSGFSFLGLGLLSGSVSKFGMAVWVRYGPERPLFSEVGWGGLGSGGESGRRHQRLFAANILSGPGPLYGTRGATRVTGLAEVNGMWSVALRDQATIRVLVDRAGRAAWCTWEYTSTDCF